jgi:serine/threonine protein kinase
VSMTCCSCKTETSREICETCGIVILARQYRTVSVISETQQGRTYLAENNGKRFFLKEFLFAIAPNIESVDAFNREAELLQQLNHPAIPKYVNNFSIQASHRDLRLYLVEEFVEGISLEDKLRRHRFSEAELISIGERVLQVLIYLHELNPSVVHRDIKPANLIEGTAGQIYVVDFGSARDVAIRDVPGKTTAGTIGYAAPEQLIGKASIRSDIFGLATTLAHLGTRKPPWEVDFDYGSSLSLLPARLQKWCRRARHRDERHRYSSGRAALDALHSYSSTERRHRTGKVALLTIAVGAAVASGASVLFSLDRPIPHVERPSSQVDLSIPRVVRPPASDAPTRDVVIRTEVESKAILLLGRISDLPCGQSGLASPYQPTKALIGFPPDDCGRSVNNSAILVNDILYYTTSEPGIHIFTPDSWDWDSTLKRSVYPSPEKNRDKILFPQCGAFPEYRVSPTGRIIHSCNTRKGSWHIDGQHAQLPDMNAPMLAFGNHDVVLFSNVLIDRNKTVVELDMLVGVDDRTIATSDGFLTISASDCRARRITEDGSSVDAGRYSAPSCTGGRVDADGVYMRLEARNGRPFYEIYQYLPDGSQGSRIYSEETIPPSNFSVLPPEFYVTAKNSTLVGPNSL